MNNSISGAAEEGGGKGGLQSLYYGGYGDGDRGRDCDKSGDHVGNSHIVDYNASPPSFPIRVSC